MNPPEAGANRGNIAAVKVNGVVYLYPSEEGGHGAHRWRIEPGAPFTQ